MKYTKEQITGMAFFQYIDFSIVSAEIKMHIKQRILETWDRWIFWKCRKTFRRMAEGGNAYLYLAKLDIDDLLKEYPISDNLKYATELFHDEMAKYTKK